VDDRRQGFDRYAIELLTEVDGTWCASLVEIPGVTAAGDDPTQTLDMLRDSFELWTADARSKGDEVPAPLNPETVSGRFLLRLPRDVHARAAREAARQGTSLNTWIVAAVAERLGQAGAGTDAARTAATDRRATG
jgi:predicted HicB family RNase H-like nuclease